MSAARVVLATAWRQLAHQPLTLATAAAGVAVAVLLMLVQLGLRQAAYDTLMAIPNGLRADLVVRSLATATLNRSVPIPRVLVQRLAGHPDVVAVETLLIGTAQWANPWTGVREPMLVYGVQPEGSALPLRDASAPQDGLRQRDAVYFDRLGRAGFGPVARLVQGGGVVEAEVNQHRVRVTGLVSCGINLATSGNLFLSQANFLRVFPTRPAAAVNLGLVRLRPGADKTRVVAELQALLGTEAGVCTREDFIAAEKRHITRDEPIDFIFVLGVVVGFVVGLVVVSQILATGVTHHLPEYATLRAIGFTHRWLVLLVVAEAILLALIGFVPGFVATLATYRVAAAATLLPVAMTAGRAALALALTVAMCAGAAVLAVRRLRSADPADVF